MRWHIPRILRWRENLSRVPRRIFPRLSPAHFSSAHACTQKNTSGSRDYSCNMPKRSQLPTRTLLAKINIESCLLPRPCLPTGHVTCICYYTFWSGVADLSARYTRGRINRNTMTKGVIKCLLQVAFSRAPSVYWSVHFRAS